MDKKYKAIDTLKNIRKEYKEIRNEIIDRLAECEGGAKRFILDATLSHIGVGISLCNRLEYDILVSDFLIEKGVINKKEKK